MKIVSKYISLEIEKHWDNDFQIGITPFCIHKHNDGFYHFHLFIDIGFWYIELTIGKEYNKM